MTKRPGGELATRPLHFIWMCDCSGSMSKDGKIQTLNNAAREALPLMRQVSDENPNAQVLMRVLTFSHGARWHTPYATPLQDFTWSDLVADSLQSTPVNADIIFLLDTSGSMSSAIEAIKRSCSHFADQIAHQGARVRLGLIGFDIGGHRGPAIKGYAVRTLSTYTIGVWKVTSPDEFKQNIQTLSLGMFGGAGCYLADPDTVEIFPHVVRAFNEQSPIEQLKDLLMPPNKPETKRILVIISDELGNTAGVPAIARYLNDDSITTHVIGVAREDSAHQHIAQKTGGRFWDIAQSNDTNDFNNLLERVANTIGQEMTKTLSDSTVSAGTDMGAALHLVAEQLKVQPMGERALPPVLVLTTDGHPTDDVVGGLQALMEQPWGKKAVRLGIAIGADADHDVLQQFIGNPELRPLHANNPRALVRYVQWVSTALLKTASAPASQGVPADAQTSNVPIPTLPNTTGEPETARDVW